MADESLKQANTWLQPGQQRAEEPRTNREYALDAFDAALLHAQAACRHIQAVKELLQEPG